MSEAFPSKYVKAADLKGQKVPVVISHVTMEDLGDGDEKPVLHFQGASKGLVLNLTNSNTIVDVYGDESSAWSGREIVLYPARTEFRGRMVDAVRIRMPELPAANNTQAPIAQPAATVAPHVAAAAQETAAQLDDDIPF